MSHWTADSKDFAGAVLIDFMLNVENTLEKRGWSLNDLAQRMGVQEKYLKQFVRNPAILPFNMAVKMARALNLKITLFMYDDEDINNSHGPIFSDLFVQCWEAQNRPCTQWDFEPGEPGKE